jgi:hypothetical protein
MTKVIDMKANGRQKGMEKVLRRSITIFAAIRDWGWKTMIRLVMNRLVINCDNGLTNTQSARQ